jgi:hypothetical protein
MINAWCDYYQGILHNIVWWSILQKTNHIFSETKTVGEFEKYDATWFPLVTIKKHYRLDKCSREIVRRHQKMVTYCPTYFLVALA